MDKWVLFDPNNNAYFTDKSGTALSPLEARYLLGNDPDEILVCGNPEEESDEYKKYMSKNLFYIQFWGNNTFGTESAANQNVCFLAPAGFDVNAREIAYYEYAIKTVSPEYRQSWEDGLEKIRNRQSITVSEEQFLQTHEAY